MIIWEHKSRLGLWTASPRVLCAEPRWNVLKIHMETVEPDLLGSLLSDEVHRG